MPKQYCFLCASDEGIFLDITRDNFQLFAEQFQTCLSVKVNEIIEPQNKICYKCTYELDQCTKFLQKYKNSHQSSKLSNTKISTPFCCLCFELIGNGHIFDITKDNHAIFSPLQKIRNIFNEDITKKDLSFKSICLACRYNLDVLYDLKKLYNETAVNLKTVINEEIDYSSFPKIHTDVVNRKTTVTTFPDTTFYASISSDSESSGKMARGKRVSKRFNTRLPSNIKPKPRNCDKCHNVVENGNDMYRFHHTGMTVCKNCWITIDPSRNSAIRRSRKSSAETKLCTVFLKDILNEKLYKKAHQERKDKKKSYVTSDDSSQNEEKLQNNLHEVENQTVNGNRKQKIKRPINTSKSDAEIISPKRTKVYEKHTKTRKIKEAKTLSDSEKPSTSSLIRMTRNMSTTLSDRGSDSDTSLLSILPKHKLSVKSDRKKLLTSSSSEMEASRKPSRKRAKFTVEIVNITMDNSDESSSHESSTSSKKSNRKLSTTSTTSSTHTDQVEIANKRVTRRKMRSSSVSSKETTPPAEFKSPNSPTMSDIKAEYVCDKCNKKFDTKLGSAEHMLTHYKQVTLKLERLTVIDEGKQETTADSPEKKISQEAEIRSTRSLSSDKRIDDLSEEVSITIEDDTDNEETIMNYPKKVNNDKEEDSTFDKHDVTTSESPVEKLSTVVENSEQSIMTESEQCENSTTVSNETTVSTELKEDNNTEEVLTNENINVSSDKRTDAGDAQKNITENHDLSEEIVESDIEPSVTDNEKSIADCNDNKEEFSDNVSSDCKMVLSPVSPLCKNIKISEDHSDHCKNDTESSDKNNETETVKDMEVIRRDITNETEREDIKDSQEENETIENDKTDLDDTVIVEKDKVDTSQMQQNESNEENVEPKMIVDTDESNNVEDTVNVNLSNCVKPDKICDNDKDQSDTAHKSIDSDDNYILLTKSGDVTEDAVVINESAKNESTEETNNFKPLFEQTTVNEKSEKQENSNYRSNSPTNAANDILKEVFDLAAAEAQKREDNNKLKNLDYTEVETLENISREIRNSADMPSLDPICAMEINEEDNDTLN